MTPFRVLAAIALVSALAVAEAHPSLWSSSFCTQSEHPTTKWSGHGPTSVDASIGFTLAWAAPDGGDAAQPNEADPNRPIPAGWEIATAEFKPGARHTLTVVNPTVGEMMVTCSHGSFEEFGRKLDGRENYGTGVRCDGKRYTVETFKKPNTRLVWNAPDAADLGADAEVVFKVTTASGWNGAFRNNRGSFTANEGLPPPPPGAASATPPPGARDETNEAHEPTETGVSAAIAAHGWFMTLAWGVLVPLGVWSARCGKTPPGVSAAADAADAEKKSDAWRRARAWLRAEGRWFKTHRACTSLGLGLAFLGLAVQYAEVEQGGGGEHFVSAHSALGAATLVLGVAQPLGAYFRPDAPTPAARAAGVGTSRARRAWEAAHRLAGAAAFVCSAFAIVSGVERAQVWGASDVSARRAYDAYVGWMVAVFVATAVLEIGRARERRDAPRSATHEEIKEVEFADA